MKYPERFSFEVFKVDLAYHLAKFGDQGAPQLVAQKNSKNSNFRIIKEKALVVGVYVECLITIHQVEKNPFAYLKNQNNFLKILD